MYLSPSEIRYSQDSIACTFSYGNHCGRPIGETLDDLLSGRCTDEDIPMMTVTFRNGHWYTGDNRRLWVFRTAEELGIMFCEIEVKKGWVNPDKFTTYNEGVDIEIRGNPGGHAWRKQMRLMKRINRNPSPPKTVKPPVPVNNLPPIIIKPKQDVPVSPHIGVPDDSRLSASNKYNNYIQDTAKHYNATHSLSSTGNPDSNTRSSIQGQDNPTIGNDEDVPSSIVNDPYKADADSSSVLVTLNSSPGVYLPTHTEDVGDKTTSVEPVAERSNVTSGTTAPDVEAGEMASYRRCTWLRSHRCVIIGVVTVSIVILTVILVTVFALS